MEEANTPAFQEIFIGAVASTTGIAKSAITIESVRMLSSRFLRNLLVGETVTVIVFVIKDNIDSTDIVNAYNTAVSSGDMLKVMKASYPSILALDDPIIITQSSQSTLVERDSSSSSSSSSNNTVLGAAIGGGIGGLLLIASIAFFYVNRESVKNFISKKPKEDVYSGRNELHDNYRTIETLVEVNPVKATSDSALDVTEVDEAAIFSAKGDGSENVTPEASKSSKKSGKNASKSSKVGTHATVVSNDSIGLKFVDSSYK